MQQEDLRKHCHKCGHRGPDEDFSKSYGKSKSHRLKYWCNECRRTFDRDFYHNRGGAEFCKKWRAKQPELTAKYSRAAYYKHRERRLSELRFKRQNDVEFIRRGKEINHRCREKLKMEVLIAYGGKCSCCGEARPMFLTIEHINHDGKEHRERTGAGSGMYRDLKQRGFPQEGLTVFCWNCQMATRFGGECPHQLEKRK